MPKPSENTDDNRSQTPELPDQERLVAADAQRDAEKLEDAKQSAATLIKIYEKRAGLPTAPKPKPLPAAATPLPNQPPICAKK